MYNDLCMLICTKFQIWADQMTNATHLNLMNIGKSTYLGRLHQQREQLHQRQEQEQHHQLPRCRSGYRCPRCSEPETLHINTASSCWVCTQTEELVILPRNPCCNAQKSNITGRPLKTPPCIKCSDFTWRLSVDKHDITRISCSSVGHG